MDRVVQSSVSEAKGGRKFDQGKAPVWRGAMQYFPRALEAVAQVSAYGREKYGSWGGWRYVPDALVRYTDGLARHLTGEAQQDYDNETRLLHAAHTAWNALARLELLLDTMALRRNEAPGEEPNELPPYQPENGPTAGTHYAQFSYDPGCQCGVCRTWRSSVPDGDADAQRG